MLGEDVGIDQEPGSSACHQLDGIRVSLSEEVPASGTPKICFPLENRQVVNGTKVAWI